MEKNVINNIFHEHALILTGNANENESLECYGCGRPVTPSETAYVCSEQSCRNANRTIFHKKCGELPTQLISHPKHAQHPIHLTDFRCLPNGPDHLCDLCRRCLGEVLGYRCHSCDFDLDITCEKLGIDALLGEKTMLQHPSHPDHPLTLMRKHALSFYCDGCGAGDVDMAYICTTCELWFHKTCALLPLILPINLQYHHHQLVLAFSFPEKYRYHEFHYKCDVCGKRFDKTCWLYYCGYCRFFAHLKCVTSTGREPQFELNNDDTSGCDVIQFPLCVNDVIKELITPFVMREKGLHKTPNFHEMPRIVEMPKTTYSYSFLFNYHMHNLSLVLEVPLEDKEEEEEDEEKDKELKICDVCVTPIYFPPYYECTPCKYFIHSICYSLPKTLAAAASSSSSKYPPHLYGDPCPKTHDNYHKFKLYTSLTSIDGDPKLYACDLCRLITTGMMYECEACMRRIDVKCASLPHTIRHASHLHKEPLIMTRISLQDKGRWQNCHACRCSLSSRVAYCCNHDDCDFALDIECLMLPTSIRNDEWDKHPLLLTFDASPDHPSDFFCNFCEVELHPKKWMYHCRQCDTSSHLYCYKAASGVFRNIKFGRQFALDRIHPHPLTFTCVTLKKRCQVCHRKVYNYRGLECDSCYYVVCLRCTMLALLLNHYFSQKNKK